MQPSRHFYLVFLVVGLSILCTPGRSQALELNPPAGFRFEGDWDCSGSFSRSGKAHRSLYHGAVSPDGRWVVLTETDIEPKGYAARYELGADASGTKLVFLDVNSAGYAIFESPGWQGQTLTVTSTEMHYAKASPQNRFIYTVKDTRHFDVEWQAGKADTWASGDLLHCSAQEPGTGVNYLVSNLSAADQSAQTLLRRALDAQGGEQKLRALKSVQWEASGYRNELEESERPEGPYITDFLSVSETRDFQKDRYRNVTTANVYPVYKTSSVLVVEGNVAMRSVDGRTLPGTPQQVQVVHERVALNPERLLLTALDAPDIHREPDTALQSVPQEVLAFTLDGAPVRVYLNAYTHLPTAVDYSGPLAHTNFWAYLGDVTMRTWYGCWWLAKGGIHLPMQRNIEGNGLPDQMLVIRKLQIDEPLPEAGLTIPAEVRAQFHPEAKPVDLEHLPLGNPAQPVKELAPGILFIPGAWNTTLVRQDDGIVILEAPISSGYSAQVMAEAHRRFPGLPVKAVITTSDSWPHLAGTREYVAEGIPIYALDWNRPILDRIITAPRQSKPDKLQRAPRRAQWQLVDGKTVLGTGANRLELYPIRGETSERQMMVYFPQQNLLYGSDPFQRGEDGSFFYPQTVTELVDAVAREHLKVDRFFMMHIGPTPWTDLAKAVAAAVARDTPNGSL